MSKPLDGRAGVQQKSDRLEFLDGFRGLAALYVVLFHISIICMDSISGREVPVGGGVYNVYKLIHYGLLFYGRYSVVLFIVLSGFCLMLPFAAPEQRQKAMDIKRFLSRRFRRIYPPYLAALLVAIVVCGMTGWDGPLAVRPVITHLFLVHNLIQDTGKISSPLWSVALEFQIYMVFAFLLFPLWRRVSVWAASALGVVIGVGLAYVGLEESHTWLLGAFSFGMVAAVLAYRPLPTAEGWEQKSRIRLLVAGIAIVGLIAIQDRNASVPALLNWNRSGLGWLTDLCFAAFSGLVFVHCTQLVRSGAKSRIVAFLQSRLVEGLGQFSYSLYLFHSTVIGFCHYFLPKNLSVLTYILCYYGVIVPVVLVVSWGMFRLVEIRFLNTKK